MTLHWRDMTTSELEREYSPSSCLPDGDYQPFIEAYQRGSAAAWSSVASVPGAKVVEVPYGRADTQTVDVAVPPADGVAPPLLVFLHGGYWQELSKVESRFAADDCVRRGWAFAAVDYTLAPAATVGEIGDECRRAVRTLMAEATTLGFDPNRIVVAGSSAGAHLAAMVALDPDSADHQLRGTVLVSGVYDLEPLIDTTINDALGLDVPTAARNSPLLADLAAFPPTIVAHGDDETGEFKAQSRAMADALAAAGVSVTSLEVPRRNHFDVILDLARPDTRLGDAVAALVDATGATRDGR